MKKFDKELEERFVTRFTSKRILVIGANGFIGKNLYKYFVDKMAIAPVTLTRNNCDLLDTRQVNRFFDDNRFDVIFNCAGRAFGILGNVEYPYNLFFENMTMQLNILEACRLSDNTNLVNIGAGCGYPKERTFPLREEELFNGLPQEESMFYSLVKNMLWLQSLALKKQDPDFNFVTAIPGNIYGEFDYFNLERAHVIPALVHKSYLIKDNDDDFEVWGNENNIRSYLYVQDFVRALVMLAIYGKGGEVYNVSSSEKTPVGQLADLIMYLRKLDSARIRWVNSNLGGQQTRSFDCTKFENQICSNFENSFLFTPLRTGLENTIESFDALYPGGVRL